MKVGVEVEALRWSIDAGNAQHRWSTREGRCLSLHGGGATGLGEASPLPGYSEDTLGEVDEALAALGTELDLDLDRPWTTAVSVGARVAPPSARFAVESAVLSLVAELNETEMWRFVGVDVPRSGSGPSVPVAEVLTAPERALEEATAAVAQGARALKLKVGRPGQLEAETQLAGDLKARFPSTELRLDANQAFGTAVDRVLRGFAEVGVDLVEEPGPIEAWGPSVDLPLALDETLRAPDASSQLTSVRSRLGALVLKPAVLGGLSGAWSWRQRAEGLGLSTITSHLFDGEVAAAALRAFALATGDAAPQGLGLARAGGARICPARAP